MFLSAITPLSAQAWVTPTPVITASVVSGSEARSGKAVRLAVTSGFFQYGQFITLQRGTAYRLSVWARAIPPTGEKGVAVTLYLRQAGEPYITYGSASAVVGTSWVLLVIPAAIVPPDTADTLSVFLINSGGTGTVFLDDASMTAVPAATPLPDLTISPPSNKPITRDYCCMNANHMWAAYSVTWQGYLWPAVDFGIFRTWDSEIRWTSIQPIDANSFNFVQMDRAAAQARARGQKVLFTLGQTPSWASSNPTLDSVYGALRSGLPGSERH